MKNIVTLIAVLLMGYAATAQVSTTGWTRGTLDTVTNAGTTNLNQSSAAYFYGNNGTFSIGFKFIKGTGTPAGNAILQESHDGYNWQNFYGTSADTFTITNVDSAAHVWHVSGAKVTNIRVSVVGSGTQVTGIRMDTKKE